FFDAVPHLLPEPSPRHRAHLAAIHLPHVRDEGAGEQAVPHTVCHVLKGKFVVEARGHNLAVVHAAPHLRCDSSRRVFALDCRSDGPPNSDSRSRKRAIASGEPPMRVAPVEWQQSRIKVTEEVCFTMAAIARFNSKSNSSRGWPGVSLKS